MSRGAVVRAESVTKTYGSGRTAVEALSEVRLDVDSGRFVALVGPSGCGKSTLLRLLASIEEPTSGSVSLDGERPSALARKHEIGVAFQDHALMPWLTVAKNVALPYRLAGLEPDWDHVDRLVELVGLADFSDSRPGKLSGGMRQRVSIARSIVLGPRLLLLDEPFGSLDLVTRRMMNLEMQRIWTELQTSTILVTHSVEEAVILADSVHVMRARPGRIVESFDVEAARPRDHVYVSSSAFEDLCRSVGASLDAAAGIGNSEGMS